MNLGNDLYIGPGSGGAGTPGAPGKDGASVDLTVANGWIQWKQADEADWIPLVALSSITGANGQSVMLQQSGDYIQWKLNSDETWQNLIAVSQLKAPANSLSIGTVTTLSAGSQATADITGDAPNQTLNLSIPAGSDGANGQSVSIKIGTVTTLSAGSSATAELAGSDGDLTLNLGLPSGNPGTNGTNGTNGQSVNLAIGTVTTLSAGSAATVTLSGTALNQTISFGIPAGAAGTNGTNGANGANNTLSIGTVSTLSSGSAATATISGTSPNQTLSLGIPQGAAGTNGTNATTTATATTTVNGLMSSTDKTKLDGINSASASVVASAGRSIGTAFTINATRNAWATYTLTYTLTATLALGQTVVVVATVDGNEVARVTDGILLGLAGSLLRCETMSFFVPAGKSVLFTKSGSSAITVTIASGQETLL